MPGVLDAIRDLDFGRYTAVPYSGSIPADYGADLMRVRRRMVTGNYGLIDCPSDIRLDKVPYPGSQRPVPMARLAAQLPDEIRAEMPRLALLAEHINAVRTDYGFTLAEIAAPRRDRVI